MKRTISLLGALVVLVIAVALVAPYVIGQQIEKQFRDAVADFSTQTEIPVKVESYKRHWFSATARTVAIAGNRHIEFDHEIQHGPWPNLNWAKVVSHPVIHDAPKLRQLFDGSPLTITTELPFSGQYALAIHSPPAKGKLTNERGETARIEWNGLTGSVQTDGDHLMLRVSVPRLSFALDSGGFVLEHMQFKASGSNDFGIPDEAEDWNSNASLSIDKLAMQDDAKNQSVSFGVLMSAHSSSANPEEVAYTTDFKLTGFRAAGFGDTPIKMDSAGLAVAVAGLRRSPIQKMLAKMKQFQQELERANNIARQRAQEQMGLIALDYLPRILSGSPSLTLEVPAIGTNHGKLGAKVEVALTPSVSTSPVPPKPVLARFMQRVAVKASAFSDRELLRWVIDQSGNPRQVQSTINQLVDQKLLAVSDDRVSTDIYYDIDKLRINGHKAPPALLQGLLQGATAGPEDSNNRSRYRVPDKKHESADAENDYIQDLRLRLTGHKNYPQRARNRHRQGTAPLYFVVAHDGQVVDWEIRKSSGYAGLDQAAVQMLKDAEPLPAMPASMDKQRIELIVPVNFSLP